MARTPARAASTAGAARAKGAGKGGEGSAGNGKSGEAEGNGAEGPCSGKGKGSGGGVGDTSVLNGPGQSFAARSKHHELKKAYGLLLRRASAGADSRGALCSSPFERTDLSTTEAAFGPAG